MQIDRELFREMQIFAQAHRIPIINEDGAGMLTETVIASQPCSILEIGTAIGYSALKIAEQMPENARIISIELDNSRIAAARQFIHKAAADDKITILEGDAGVLIAGLPQTFDLVFIDAAKGQYLNYFLKVEGKLNPGAVIIADNVLFRGYVESNDAPPRRYRTLVKRLREYLQYVTRHPDFITTLYRVGDGIAVSRHRRIRCE